MKKFNQTVVRMMMAVVITFGVEVTASAQFGGLKGLANKAKKAVKEKVNETKSDATSQAESTASEASGVSTSAEENSRSASGSSTAVPKKEIRVYADDFYYKLRKPKRMDWTYESDMRDVVADMGYWLKRLRASAEKDDKSQLDIEALDRLTKGRPSFDFVDREYTDGMISEAELGIWQNERLAVCRAATEVRDGVELDLKWKILDANDEEKALKKEITQELHKGTLLKRYKEAAQMNRYKPAISGNDAWVTKLVRENFPEWGKILASKINTDYKVNYDALHNPKSRYHSAVVMCQDQGYKVLHYIQLSQPYKGGGKYGPSEVRYGGMKWSDAVTLVK